MTHELQFREPTLKDAGRLADLGRDTFIETFGHHYRPQDLECYLSEKYTPEAIIRELENPALCYQVAGQDDFLVAFAKIGPLDLHVDSPLPKAGEIKQLYVRETFTGKGVGKHLMSWAMSQLKLAGLENLYLSVFSENYRAIRFYQNYGFKKHSEYHYPVGEHLDLEWIMHLHLDPSIFGPEL